MVEQKYGRRHTTTYHYAQIVLRHIRRSQSPIYPKWIEWNTQIEDFSIHFFFTLVLSFSMSSRLLTSSYERSSVFTHNYIVIAADVWPNCAGRFIVPSIYVFICIYFQSHTYIKSMLPVACCKISHTFYLWKKRKKQQQKTKKIQMLCVLFGSAREFKRRQT